jgi:hypothetical protein
MVKYLGSFSGTIKSVPQPTIDYQSTQSVKIFVKQCEQILCCLVVEGIDHIVGKKFNFEFAYIDTINQISLCIETCIEDDQFNRDIPVELVQLCVDYLYAPKHFVFQGHLQNKNKKIIDKGNVLWCTGQLNYKFNLPIVSNVLYNHLR